MVNATRKQGSVIERAYLDSCARNMSGGKPNGLRFIPKSELLELNEPLPTSAAMGHYMMTAGLNPQYHWCNICCARLPDTNREAGE